MRIVYIAISVIISFTVSLDTWGGSYSVFDGEWHLPANCEVNVLGSLKWEQVQAWCPLNEDNVEKTDYVTVSFKKKDTDDLERLESIAKTDTLVRETVGALTVTTWEVDFVKSGLKLWPDMDSEVIDRRRGLSGFYRTICDDQVCIHMNARYLGSLEELSRSNIDSHNKALKSFA